MAPDEPAEPPHRARTLAMFGVGVVVATFLWWAGTNELPYYAIAPGSALDASRLVAVDPAHDNPPAGSIFLTTVTLGKVTLLEALQGWLDPAVDVVKERVIAPADVDASELRLLNLQAMDESKNLAIGVAFEALGVDAITETGAVILTVERGSPADGALSPGDVIVAVGDVAVHRDTELVAAIGARSPGDTVTFSVVRGPDTEPTSVDLTLATRPDDATRGYLGVSLGTRSEFDFPFEVDLNSREIGGPSAGLAFTLAVIDQLTPGELTGGTKVATTGTIELDGSVGEVGGVAQKTIAVNRSGATLFLVPSGEVAEARRFADDDLEIAAVDTLDEALAALAEVGGNGLALPNLAGEGAS